MRTLLTKSVLLLAGVMTVSSFTVPSMASAASWGPLGTEHTLISPDFSVDLPGPLEWYLNTSCAQTAFTVQVRSSAALAITGATFKGCTSTGFPYGNCTATLTATNLPWTVTGVTTANIQIHNIRIDQRYAARPDGTGNCTLVGTTSNTVTGTLTGGSWTSSQHEVKYYYGSGLASNLAFFGSATVFATFRDTSQSLTLT
ncbi:MAG TPA: hypothetical protein VFY45_22260 [Baekduia sp.]|nr:hypothetical protein [Baekduia sp.]